jgi:hypothetical protein
MDRYLTKSRFKRSPSDPNLYVRSIHDDVVIIVVYVDDIIITRSEAGTIGKL